jgi:MFS family permease
MAIAVFHAIGAGIGGVAAPALFGALIQSGSRASVFIGYAVASLLMLAAAVVAPLFAVRAERKPLEEAPRPFVCGRVLMGWVSSLARKARVPAHYASDPPPDLARIRRRTLAELAGRLVLLDGISTHSR